MVTLGCLAPLVGASPTRDLVDLGAGARALLRRLRLGRRRRAAAGGLRALHERGVDLPGGVALGDQLVGAPSSSSMISLNSSNGCAPWRLRPLMKKFGVPCAPICWPAPCRPAMRALPVAAVERRLELAHVEAELLRVLLEVGALEVLLVGEQLVVHLPELPLRLGRDRRLGRQRRVRVERQRVVAEDDPDLLAVLLLDLRPASGRTRLQNGHWKSENATIVTFASAGPLRRAFERHAHAVDAVAGAALFPPRRSWPACRRPPCCRWWRAARGRSPRRAPPPEE